MLLQRASIRKIHLASVFWARLTCNLRASQPLGCGVLLPAHPGRPQLSVTPRASGPCLTPAAAPTQHSPGAGLAPGARLLCPWDSPGKNTGVGCHFLRQCMKVKHESEVAQSCLTLHDPMDCSLPGSSTHGVFQARVLEWLPREKTPTGAAARGNP